MWLDTAMRPTHKPLGEELRRLRDRKGLTQRQAAAEVGMTAPTLSRLELGTTQRPDLSDVLELLDFYDPDPPTRERVTLLARFASARSIYRAIGDMGERQRSYAELEAVAVDIREYQHVAVPGLLQTTEYAKARVASAGELYADLDTEVEAQARTSRQEVLHRADPPLAYEAIIDETALVNALAPPEVMNSQLRYLVDLASLPNVTLRVVRLAAKIGEYYMPQTAFSVYRSPALATVVVETLTSDIHLRDESDIGSYDTVWGWLSAAAMSPTESGEFISSLAAQHQQEQ